MEFMLSEALPIYSGGLGNVAGDQLKAASDLGVPVVGVGLLYQHGYFRQVIDRDGAQQALYPYNDPGQLPVTPVRQPNGEWLRLEIALPGYSVWLRAWQVQVGRVKALPARHERRGERSGPSGHHQRALWRRPGIASETGDRAWDRRLAIAAALGLKPEVCHLNEGHAAFALLERARGFMAETGQPFAVALAATRAGNLFTTHTAVAAGFDLFSPALMEQYLGRYAQDKLGLSSARPAGAGTRRTPTMRRAFQHGLSGHPRQRRGQRGEPAARPGEPAHLCAALSRGGRRTRCRSAT